MAGCWVAKGQAVCIVWSTWTKRWFVSQVGQSRQCNISSCYSDATHFKNYELFISGVFHLTLSDLGWPLVTGIMKSKTADKKALLLYLCLCISSAYHSVWNVVSDQWIIVTWMCPTSNRNRLLVGDDTRGVKWRVFLFWKGMRSIIDKGKTLKRKERKSRYLIQWDQELWCNFRRNRKLIQIEGQVRRVIMSKGSIRFEVKRNEILEKF